MLNTDALLRSPFSEEPVVPNASHALGRLSLAESPAGFCQPPRLFTTKVTLLPTKPRSNDRLSERIKDDNLSPLRITLKGCYCSKSPHEVGEDCCWNYITAQLVHLPTLVYFFSLPQVLLAGCFTH